MAEEKGGYATYTKSEREHSEPRLQRPKPTLPPETSSVTDSHTLSCLWDLNDFYWCGYKKSNLLPVKQSLLATNKHPKNIEGAIFIRLSGKDKNGNIGEVPVIFRTHDHMAPKCQSDHQPRYPPPLYKVIVTTFPLGTPSLP